MYISIYIFKLYFQIEESKIHMQTSSQSSGHVTAATRASWDRPVTGSMMQSAINK